MSPVPQRNPDLLQHFVTKLSALRLPRHVRIMEVCGGHTAAIHRFALPDLLPPEIELLSGPGCPVCVTDDHYIDGCLALAQRDDVTLASFGDLIRVPGTNGSLADARAQGADVRVLYSPMEAVEWARKEPGKTMILLAIGFETTACTITAALSQAVKEKLTNFRAYSALKMMPQALRVLLSDPQVSVDGLILPGHVITVTGVAEFEFIAREFGMQCAVSGFEPSDLLHSILLIAEQIADRRSEVMVQYARSVRYEGNPDAQRLIEQLFEPCDSEWRGLGLIRGSGLRLRREYSAWDAATMVPSLKRTPRDVGCRCGDVLRGLIHPADCALFGLACTPETPRGACMVSSEGACAAVFQYADV